MGIGTQDFRILWTNLTKFGMTKIVARFFSSYSFIYISVLIIIFLSFFAYLPSSSVLKGTSSFKRRTSRVKSRFFLSFCFSFRSASLSPSLPLLTPSSDFVSSAKMYGRIIILERFLKTKKQLKKSGWKEGFAFLDFLFLSKSVSFLFFRPCYLSLLFCRRDPQLPKTIDPVSLGGVAGGDKYIVNNIVFKFAGFSLFPFSPD